jgi:hypothetical protein
MRARSRSEEEGNTVNKAKRVNKKVNGVNKGNRVNKVNGG